MKLCWRWDIYNLTRPADGKPEFNKLVISIDSNLNNLDLELKKRLLKK